MNNNDYKLIVIGYAQENGLELEELSNNLVHIKFKHEKNAISARMSEVKLIGENVIVIYKETEMTFLNTNDIEYVTIVNTNKKNTPDKWQE